MLRGLSLIVLLFSFSSAKANVVGADTQNFNPTPDGLDFVTVQSSETLKPGIFNLGVFVNYAVNSLPNYEDVSNGDRTNFRDSLTSSDLNLGVGILDGWSVGFSMPYLLSQSVDSDVNSFRGEFAETGLTEYRLNTKVRFTGDQDGGVGAVLTANFNQIENNPFLGEGAGPTVTLELVADTTVGQYAMAANVGYRLRSEGDQIVDVPVEPFGDQMIASAAVSYLLTEYDTKLIGEVFGSIPVESADFASDRDVSSMELLLGLKHDLNRKLAWHAGAGTEIYQGSSSPDWRLYTGLNYSFGPVKKSQNIITRVNDRDEIIVEDDPFAEIGTGSESFVARDVLFKFDSAEVDEAFREALQRMADYLRRPPGFKSLVIEGHTDSIGSAAYNLKLSQRRADSVRRVLIQSGLSAKKVRAVGYGESQPIGDNGNFQGRKLNRRVEFSVTR
ncbi:MAG: OmpA family protein [Bdellovibrionales bacterium]|nr:OmpA family protein [Bdellovibrionales bacterium]